MKCKVLCKNLIVFAVILIAVFFSALCANAVDGDEAQDIVSETEIQEPAVETEPVIETQAPTEAPAEPPAETPTEPVTEWIPETEAPVETSPVTEEVNNYTEAEQTYNKEQEATVAPKTLPTIAPTTEHKPKAEGDLTYGYVSWACVVAGILVLAIIMLSTIHSGKKKNKRR